MNATVSDGDSDKMNYIEQRSWQRSYLNNILEKMDISLLKLHFISQYLCLAKGKEELGKIFKCFQGFSLETF